MNNNQQQQVFRQNMQSGPGWGLTRYRSAPSSYFASLLDAPADGAAFGGDDLDHLFNPRASSLEAQRIFPRFMGCTDTVRGNSSAANPRLSSQFTPPPEKTAEPRQPPESSYGLLGSYGGGQLKMESAVGNNPGLVRQSSSPAGLFPDIVIENEFGTMRAMESFKGGYNNCGSNASVKESSSSTNRFKHEMDFSSRYSSSGMMETIPETDLKGMGESSVENRHFSQDRGNTVDYITGLPMGAWKSASNPSVSSPESSGKLQELVPNMEKQTNTSDMLDLAVDYIKDLQRQVKTLSDNRARCSCSAKQIL
ncbi:Transcription factor bHLH130 [Striga hermonthica]|uniref:Transcription factor bHLH130 n=1 Tax=Striga hermonthica TaxID=68872 RepID=A0A9N7MAV7_STRHE|nr:Transcription factor bHLH130 [Striga hermonthica]